MNEQLIAILSKKWMSETAIIRAVYAGRRDSEISDVEWSEALGALRLVGQSRNIGHNEYLWRAR